jgi:hypothetical protein
MADQPERPIEKLLRECGKRRLPSDTVELHPANRRLLQDEVARTYRRKGARAGWFGAGLLPKLAWGFCMFSVVGLAVWFSIRSGHQTESDSRLVRNEKTVPSVAPANAPFEQVKTEPAPALQSNLSLADNLATGTWEAATKAALNFQSTGAPQPDGRTMVSMNLPEHELAKEATAKSEFAGAAAARAPEPTATAGGVYRYGLASTAVTPTAAALLKQTSPSTTVEKFMREPASIAQTDEEKRAQPVLASFKFERTGSAIRIIDQDGSLYSGTLGAPQTQFLLKAARRDQPAFTDSWPAITATKTSSPAAMPEEFTFHVTGTNRTLGELVSFEGRWSMLTNVPPLVQVSKDGNRGIALDRQLPAATRTGGRISGTAIIKGDTAIPINAVSAGP